MWLNRAPLNNFFVITINKYKYFYNTNISLHISINTDSTYQYRLLPLSDSIDIGQMIASKILIDKNTS